MSFFKKRNILISPQFSLQHEQVCLFPPEKDKPDKEIMVSKKYSNLSTHCQVVVFVCALLPESVHIFVEKLNFWHSNNLEIFFSYKKFILCRPVNVNPRTISFFSPNKLCHSPWVRVLWVLSD